MYVSVYVYKMAYTHAQTLHSTKRAPYYSVSFQFSRKPKTHSYLQWKLSECFEWMTTAFFPRHWER